MRLWRSMQGSMDPAEATTAPPLYKLCALQSLYDQFKRIRRDRRHKVSVADIVGRNVTALLSCRIIATLSLPLIRDKSLMKKVRRSITLLLHLLQSLICAFPGVRSAPDGIG